MNFYERVEHWCRRQVTEVFDRASVGDVVNIVLLVEFFN